MLDTGSEIRCKSPSKQDDESTSSFSGPEKAMESGQPIPEEIMSVDKQSEGYLWKRGVRNVAIGLGLMLMFWIWDSETLVGIGVLIFCYGIGQMIISKTNRN